MKSEVLHAHAVESVESTTSRSMALALIFYNKEAPAKKIPSPLDTLGVGLTCSSVGGASPSLFSDAGASPTDTLEKKG